MFRRFLKGNNNNSSHPHKEKKKRISPTNNTVVPGVTTTGSLDHGSAAMIAPGYQYALNEFAQTVAPATSNEDGRYVVATTSSTSQSDDAILHGRDTGYVEISASEEEMQVQSPTDSGGGGGPYHRHYVLSSASSTGGSRLQGIDEGNEDDATATSAAAGGTTPSLPRIPTSSFPYRTRQAFPPYRFADAVYEEWYGDAYLGGPIKYVYPSGYQSMRPRGGPWRLSIVVFLLMSWLSVFIIGHCSDRADQYDAENATDEDLNDDKALIERRWCGSQLLYMMWVVSMLITGLAAAYCSVIGYIKVRDFAVANTRSQPPGLVGKSDYYVQLQDAVAAANVPGNYPPPSQQHPNDETHHEYYQRTIYQSDGNPQFWGAHIYRPTQAAVAVTSR